MFAALRASNVSSEVTPIETGADKWAKLRSRRLSVIKMPTQLESIRNLAVHACIFLETRPQSPDHGTLLAALENGVIQVYSHHRLGNYITQFNAIHIAGDCVLAMATEKTNTYLFTGTALGYIKTWVVTNLW